jgi:aldehyde:ferredoxin oxidoreductase
MNGYTGKILNIDLSTGEISSIPTAKYEQWMGGHGMGSAIFFDRVKDKTIDGLDPQNVVTIMTSPFTGTLVPGASARTEVQGIGVQSFPIGWFTRSNFGGRFSPMLKFAGWDGIVLEGKADRPVWLDIRNDKVVIRDANGLWGKDTKETQETIWDNVMAGQDFGEWMDVDGDRSTQKPAVLTIGPAGENLSRLACLIHDASNAAGQGGFGAVWGSKNLKAISVIGTGAVSVNDPKALMAARLWQKENYAFDLDNLKMTWTGFGQFHGSPTPVALYRGGRPKVGQRPQACMGCHSGCRARYADGLGNEASCYTTAFYWDADNQEIQRQASDLLNLYGLNAVEMIYGLLYIDLLDSYGQLKGGGIPDCPLDFDDMGSLEFVEQFVKMVAYGDDGLGNESQFGKDVSGGFVWAAEKWGRRKQDLNNGMLQFPYWGLPIHKEPRAQVYWGYGTLLGDRDINEHDLDWLKADVAIAKQYGGKPMAGAKKAVKIITDKMVPYDGDLHMLDFSAENIYSEHMAKLVSWHRYYTRFWKQSMLFCDVRWPDFMNAYAPDLVGSTGIAEPKYLKAVTGKDFSFLDGINLGKKIWNLDHAIWTLQGRHRDMVHFADIVYNEIPKFNVHGLKPYMPGFEKGMWDYHYYGKRTLDRDKFDEFKTRFYKLQGWDPATGYPTGETLESLGLGYVAAELEQTGKLGRS